jgi:hypothetical protein
MWRCVPGGCDALRKSHAIVPSRVASFRMANFFHTITGDGITSLEVRRNSKFRVGLEGGGPAPKYERLNVTTSPAAAPDAELAAKDPAVRLTQDPPKESWKLIYEIDPAKMQSNKVRACWNNSDYSEPVVVTFESEAEIRKSIVTLARSFVSTAHYLWGTAGNEPGKGNGNPGGGKQMAAKMRDYSLDPKEAAREKVLAVRTAVQPVFDGYNTCAGRSGLYKDAPDLDAFVKACQDAIAKGTTDQTKWDGAGPRKTLFPRKYYFRGNIQNSGAVVWGDSCDGVPHFDCVGLVNYCYAKHWYQSNFGLGISAYRNANQGTAPVDNDKDLMDGDILIKSGDGHIGMLYDGGSGWFVVQAVGTATGLTETSRFNSSDWDRYRMNAAFLVGKHS